MSADPGPGAHERLEQLVDRLEEITVELRGAGDDSERVDRLAKEALDLSSSLGDALQRVIREIEDAAQSGPAVPAMDDTATADPVTPPVEDSAD